MRAESVRSEPADTRGVEDAGRAPASARDGRRDESAPVSPESSFEQRRRELEHGIRLCEIDLGDEKFTIVSMPAYNTDSATPLTPGERDIVVRILLGQSNQEIANARGSRLSTVSNQVYSIFDKLGVESRTQLAERMVPRSAGR